MTASKTEERRETFETMENSLLLLPENHFGTLYLRSSFAKQGLTISGGLIDSDYFGTLKLIVNNIGGQNVKVKKYEPIAQLVVSPYLSQSETKFEVQKAPTTGELHTGFGSTSK